MRGTTQGNDRRRRRGWRGVLALLLALVLGLGVLLVVSSSAGPAPGGPTIGVGFGPTDMALDQRSRHLFVLERRGIDQHGALINAGAVTMIAAATGTVLRTMPVGESPTWIGIVEATQRAFVVDLSYPAVGSVSVHVLDTTTGAVLRTVPLLTAPPPPAAVMSPGGTINVTAGTSASMGPGALAVDEQAGHVFVVNRVSYGSALPAPIISMLDARDGVLRTVIHLPGAAFAVATDPTRHHVFATSAGTGAVWMLDSRTGALLRTLRATGSGSAVAISQSTGQVIVASPGTPGRVSLFAARDGRLLATVAVGTLPYPLKMAVDERHGRAFLLEPGDNGGPAHVVTLALPAGQLLARLPLDGDPVDMALSEGRARVFVITQPSQRQNNGATSVFDVRTGHLLTTWGVGFQPAAVVEDEAGAHVFVMNQQASVREHGAFAGLADRIRNVFFPGGNEERGVITIHPMHE